MRAILPTTSASVHPAGTLPGPSRQGAELPDRSRWFQRVGDFFLGAPSSGLPVTTPAPHLAGDNKVTTTEETPEEPIIRWFCAFDFKRDEDNEALVADGWRWRMQCFFVMQVFGTSASLFSTLGVLPRWVNTFALAFWVAATATVLALFQNSSCLRRSTAATMLHAISHLVFLAVCIISLFVDADLGTVLSSPNASSVGGALSSLSSNTTVLVISFDAWVRREIVLSLLIAPPILFALLLPTSRAGRWFGIVFQLTAVPAIQVRGERGGGGKSVRVTRLIRHVRTAVFPQLYSDT